MHIDPGLEPDVVRRHYLYIIRNKVNQKCCVGATKSPTRFGEHKRDCLDIEDTRPLYVAMREYGVENFEFEVLLTNLTEKEAFDLESVYIKKYDTLHPNGYNLSTGGKGAPGVSRGPETRSLMSAAAKITSAKEPIKKARSELLAHRWKHDTEFIESVLAAVRGKRKGWSEESKAARSEQLKGNKRLLGHKHSDETRKKISLALKGKKLNLSDEERKRRSEIGRNLHKFVGRNK